MPRPIVRALVAVCASVVLVALGLAVWLLPTVRSQAAALFAPGILASTQRYCSNWDFVNNSGQDVNGLHVRLESVKTVSAVYTGTLNPFGAPVTAVYSPSADVYDLDFGGATVFDSDRVQIGLCTDAPLLRLGGSGLTAFAWISNTAPVTSPLFTGLEWNWQAPNHLRIRIVNEQSVTETLTTLNLLDAGNELPLNELDGDATTQMGLVLELAPAPQPLGPQLDSFFDVYFDLGDNVTPPDHAGLQPNHPFVIEAVLSDPDDETSNAHLFAQGISPLARVSLPVISR